MSHKCYLDHHTVTRPIASAIETMLPYYQEKWGVIADPHGKDNDLIEDYEKAEKRILHILGDEETRRLHLTSSGAEAINSAFFSHYFNTVRVSGQNHMLAGHGESASILLSMQRMEEFGCSGKLLSVNCQGQITKEMLLKAIRPRTGFFSISWAQSLTGVIQPIADLAEVCQEKNIAFHVDASHVIGKLYFCLRDFEIDFFTFDGKLLHAPQGSGGLIMKKSHPFSPLILGNDAAYMPTSAALSEALSHCASACDHMCLETARLRDKLEQEIKRAIPDAVIFFEQVERLPNCTAIGFPGVSAEALLFLLHRHGVYAALGGGIHQRLSHILISSGIDSILAESALAFSLSFETEEAEIDYAIETITSCVHQLKSYSIQIMKDF